MSVFPDELYPAPRSWAERAYPKLIHYNKLDKGGHFAAWEQPELFFQKRFARASDRCANSGPRSVFSASPRMADNVIDDVTASAARRTMRTMAG